MFLFCIRSTDAIIYLTWTIRAQSKTIVWQGGDKELYKNKQDFDRMTQMS